MNEKLNEHTFLIIGLFVGTTVTFSLYMLSNSVLSVAAVPVIPQSFGNCRSRICKYHEVRINSKKMELLMHSKRECSNLEKEVLVTNRSQCYSFILDGQTFFCFDCLVKSITPSPSLKEKDN